MALPTRDQIAMEAWGTLDRGEIFRIKGELHHAPPPPLETWTTLKIPYQTPSCPRLLSLDELTAATNSNRLNEKIGLNDVCRVGDTVVKYSAKAAIVEEAETLLFLAEKLPQLRIPKVLALWTVLAPAGHTVFCLMTNFIEGISLSNDNFMNLSDQAQDTICAKISAQLKCLRSLPSEGYYGRVHRQGWVHLPGGLRTATKYSRPVTGPYNTYEEFASAIYRSFELHRAYSDEKGFPPSYAATMAKLQSMCSDWDPHEPTFTWMDPKPMNVIAQPIKGHDGNEDWEVVLLDWECCGWYPAWLQTKQIYDRWGAFYRNPSQSPTQTRLYPFLSYRPDEMTQVILKEFDPNPDWKKMTVSRELDWRFY